MYKYQYTARVFVGHTRVLRRHPFGTYLDGPFGEGLKGDFGLGISGLAYKEHGSIITREGDSGLELEPFKSLIPRSIYSRNPPLGV